MWLQCSFDQPYSINLQIHHSNQIYCTIFSGHRLIMIIYCQWWFHSRPQMQQALFQSCWYRRTTQEYTRMFIGSRHRLLCFSFYCFSTLLVLKYKRFLYEAVPIIYEPFWLCFAWIVRCQWEIYCFISASNESKAKINYIWMSWIFKHFLLVGANQIYWWLCVTPDTQTLW